MASFIHPGDVMEFTAPDGGVVKGTGVLIGDLLVIPVDSAATGELFRGYATGVHEHAKPGSEAWDEGEIVYWDDGDGVFTTEDAGNYIAGTAAAAVGSGAGETTGRVRLNGTPVELIPLE